MKYDDCNKCEYMVNYDFNEVDGVVEITPTPPTASLDEIYKLFGLWFKPNSVSFIGRYPVSADEQQQVFDINATAFCKFINKTYIKRSDVVGMLPEKQNIVTLTEPPQGIDRLWLEGRDYGVTAGYNQAIDDIKNALGEGL